MARDPILIDPAFSWFGAMLPGQGPSRSLGGYSGSFRAELENCIGPRKARGRITVDDGILNRMIRAVMERMTRA